MPKTVYLRDSQNNTLRGVAFSVTTAYLALHTADPTSSGSNEVTGGSYARQAIVFNASSVGLMTGPATTDIVFTSMPAVTVGFFSVWDAVSGGHMLWWGQFTGTASPTTGQNVRVTAGTITLTESS